MKKDIYNILGITNSVNHTLNNKIKARTKVGQAIKAILAYRKAKQLAKNDNNKFQYEDEAGNYHNSSQVFNLNRNQTKGQVVTAAKMNDINGEITFNPSMRNVQARRPEVILDRNYQGIVNGQNTWHKTNSKGGNQKNTKDCHS